MTPTERAFKHGVLRARNYGRHGLKSGIPYRDPEMARQFRRGFESIYPQRIEYTMPPRQEPTR